MARSLSKRLRFEIFKRDGFTCVYCGAIATTVPLQVDHVLAVSDGGTNAPSNLVTSCVDCNAGKSNVPLDARRVPARQNPKVVRDHAEQIRAYLSAQQELHEARQEIVSRVRNSWQVFFPKGNTPRELAMFRAWVEQFPLGDIERAINIAGVKGLAHVPSFMYLCGIMRRWRAEGVQ